MKLNRAAGSVSIAAELSHVFCCGLPVVVALLSAGAQVGLGSGFLFIHDIMHAYERPILAGSGLLLVAGLILQYVSFRIDCRNTGCAHSDCAPKKMQVSWIFRIAVVMYAANLAFYFLSGHGLA
ncbi:MAG: hypothetical protein ACR2OX_11990 [Methyloligellaceae bacterium]